MRGERRFDPLFRGIEPRPHGGPIGRCELAEALLQFSQRARFAQIARLGMLELGRICDAGKQLKRLLNNGVEFFHALSEKKGG